MTTILVDENGLETTITTFFDARGREMFRSEDASGNVIVYPISLLKGFSSVDF